MNILQTIEHILATTPDPSSAKTMQDMLIKHTINLEDQHAFVYLSVGFPTKLLKQTWLPVLQTSLEKALPTYQINLIIDQFIKAHRTQLPGMSLRNVKNTIAIASGKGGVGKSTIAVNLAVALAALGARVGILDADIYGPSIPTMLGKHEPVRFENERYVPIEAHGIQAMSIGYLTNESNSTLIWRGPMLAKSLLKMLDITAWDELDYLFIDLPPGTGDIQLSLVQKIPLSGAIVVTTPQNIATLDAHKALNLFEKTNIPILGIIENMAVYHCESCGHQAHLFGQGGAQTLSQNHGCERLGQLPLNAQIREQCDQGTPSASYSTNELKNIFTTLALKTAMAINQRPLNYADKFPPIVVE